MRRRRQHKEKEKPRELLFSKTKEEAPRFFPAPARTISQEALQIKIVKHQALQILTSACNAIEGGTQEEARQNQSKALELARQKIASEIRDIEIVQNKLYQIKAAIAAADFACHHERSAKRGEVIRLGSAFHQLDEKGRIVQLMQAATKQTRLFDREGLPLRQKENRDSAKAWVEYVFCLLQLLPEQPYLITGTPIQAAKPLKKEEEEKKDKPQRALPPGPVDSIRRLLPAPAMHPPAKVEEEEKKNFWKRLTDVIRRFFSRKKPKS